MPNRSSILWWIVPGTVIALILGSYLFLVERFAGPSKWILGALAPAVGFVTIFLVAVLFTWLWNRAPK